MECMVTTSGGIFAGGSTLALSSSACRGFRLMGALMPPLLALAIWLRRRAMSRELMMISFMIFEFFEKEKAGKDPACINGVRSFLVGGCKIRMQDDLHTENVCNKDSNNR